MIPNPELSLTRLELSQPLAVLVRKAQAAPVLAHEPVRLADFAQVASEAWRDGCLRAGHPDWPLSETPMRLSPILADGSDSRCAGFELEPALPEGQTSRRLFSYHCLHSVAERAMAPLLEAGVESGGALFGSLAACPETGEFFPVIRDAIAVQEAEEKKFSLAYSGATWVRLQQIQRARQAAYPARADRLLGQTHGCYLLPDFPFP